MSKHEKVLERYRDRRAVSRAILDDVEDGLIGEREAVAKLVKLGVNPIKAEAYVERGDFW